MKNLAEAGEAALPPGRGEIFHISEGEAIFFICSKEESKKISYFWVQIPRSCFYRCSLEIAISPIFLEK